MSTLLLFLFVPTLFVGQTYCAVSTPHIIIGAEVWLYNDTGEAIFMLPESYYALISNIDESYYYVTFNGVKGKVDKSLVSTVGYESTATGTMAEGAICEEYAIFTEIKLKSRPDKASADCATIPTTETITYIGSYPTAESTWYYVKCKDTYGYIPQHLTTLNDMEVPTFVPQEPPESTDPEEDKPKSGLSDSSLRTIIIVGLSIPAVLIIYLLFKPQKTKDYYEDED